MQNVPSDLEQQTELSQAELRWNQSERRTFLGMKPYIEEHSLC